MGLALDHKCDHAAKTGGKHRQRAVPRLPACILTRVLQ